MFTSSVRRRLILASVLLVLAGLLLPAMSAVLRLRTGTVGASVGLTGAPTGLEDVCVAAGPGVSHPEAEASVSAQGLVRLLHLLQACEHCAQAPLASALPLPDAPDLPDLAPQVRALRFAAFEAGTLRRPAFLRPAGRRRQGRCGSRCARTARPASSTGARSRPTAARRPAA